MSALPQPSAAEATLAAWQARDAEVRARRQHAGLGKPEQFAGRTGMQVFEAMLAGEIPYPPISGTLDFFLVEAEPGRVQFQGRPQFAHYNPLGSVHGGWIATLLDSAVACAVHTLLPAGKTYTTLELKVNYVKALTDKVPLVRAIGEIIYSGGRIGTSQGRLVGPDGTLFAHATTTCIVLDAR
ncbi:PaaI family thioesterase [Piscinibacter sp. XHJ-5]|uniref:PaaI family thioesterase n=1 Tax=Piscinibacter sp. XHJ-5 TaxID=3037797 RepID=UPI002452C7F6|nr:PaaI family thioesterase [Piscinibacter sp. XHJ-5]